MTVRARLTWVIFVIGLITALGVIATVALAFQRFEHERTYDRGVAFLDRVLVTYRDMLALRERHPDQLEMRLKSLLLFEPDTNLYLLAPDGTVLTSTSTVPLALDLQVALEPVRQAAAAAEGGRRMPYVMGDDPQRMSADAVITARTLRRSQITRDESVAGYLYLVAHSPSRRPGQLELFGSSLLGPALGVLLALIAATTLLAVWIVRAVTLPLHVLSGEVATAARDGFDAVPASSQLAGRRDEFGRLRRGFDDLLRTLRQQWDALRAMDHFRREGVSNLSHDLRSPLTATAVSLETLQQRWADDPARAADLPLVEVALRNTQNAAQLVRSLGDLALLDEPQYKIDLTLLDAGEVIDDIALRFADRAARQGVALRSELAGEAARFVRIDVELFERAVANLVDNALKFTPRGGSVVLSTEVRDGQVRVRVADSGAGIAEADVPHLFDRLFQSRGDSFRSGSEGGKGLGLAIVRRIVELHHGHVTVHSAPDFGTHVTISLPCA